jgi:hypothetical protein
MMHIRVATLPTQQKESWAPTQNRDTSKPFREQRFCFWEEFFFLVFSVFFKKKKFFLLAKSSCAVGSRERDESNSDASGTR